jgi:hypothetical protein
LAYSAPRESHNEAEDEWVPSNAPNIWVRLLHLGQRATIRMRMRRVAPATSLPPSPATAASVSASHTLTLSGGMWWRADDKLPPYTPDQVKVHCELGPSWPELTEEQKPDVIVQNLLANIGQVLKQFQACPG